MVEYGKMVKIVKNGIIWELVKCGNVSWCDIFRVTRYSEIPSPMVTHKMVKAGSFIK